LIFFTSSFMSKGVIQENSFMRVNWQNCIDLFAK